MKSLSERAILMSLNISQWTARKYDKTASQEVASNHNVSLAVGRYNKALIKSEEIKKVNKAANKLRTYFYDQTLPWTTELRIRPTKGYLEFMAELGKLESGFKDAATAFCDKFAQLQNEAQIELKSLYNPMDYPDIIKLASKFGVSVSVVPLPKLSDFRVDLSQEEIAKLGQQLKERQEEATKKAMSSVWTRLYEAIKHMAERLNDTDAIFRDSLISNLQELTEILPVLNITNDPNLSRLCSEAKKLCEKKPSELRDNPSARGATGKLARQLANDIKQIGKKDPDIFDDIISGA